jgi:hypothetical protein
LHLFNNWYLNSTQTRTSTWFYVCHSSMAMNRRVVFNKFMSISSNFSQSLRSTNRNLIAHWWMSFGAIRPKWRASNEIDVNFF